MGVSGIPSRSLNLLSVVYFQNGKKWFGVRQSCQTSAGYSRGHLETPISIRMFWMTLRSSTPVVSLVSDPCRRHCSPNKYAWRCQKLGIPSPKYSLGEYTRASGYVRGSLVALSASIFNRRVICLHSCWVNRDVVNWNLILIVIPERSDSHASLGVSCRVLIFSAHTLTLFERLSITIFWFPSIAMNVPSVPSASGSQISLRVKGTMGVPGFLKYKVAGESRMDLCSHCNFFLFHLKSIKYQ